VPPWSWIHLWRRKMPWESWSRWWSRSCLSIQRSFGIPANIVVS
jgi:hypothetical protein